LDKLSKRKKAVATLKHILYFLIGLKWQPILGTIFDSEGVQSFEVLASKIKADEFSNHYLYSGSYWNNPKGSDLLKPCQY